MFRDGDLCLTHPALPFTLAPLAISVYFVSVLGGEEVDFRIKCIFRERGREERRGRKRGRRKREGGMRTGFIGQDVYKGPAIF